MNLHLEDKVALVTGSTAGIGFAIAAGLAAEGARVIVNGRTEKRVQEAVTAIAEQHPEARLEPLAADLATAQAAEQTIARSITLAFTDPNLLKTLATRIG